MEISSILQQFTSNMILIKRNPYNIFASMNMVKINLFFATYNKLSKCIPVYIFPSHTYLYILLPFAMVPNETLTLNNQQFTLYLKKKHYF